MGLKLKVIAAIRTSSSLADEEAPDARIDEGSSSACSKLPQHDS